MRETTGGGKRRRGVSVRPREGGVVDRPRGPATETDGGGEGGEVEGLFIHTKGRLMQDSSV